MDRGEYTDAEVKGNVDVAGRTPRYVFDPMYDQDDMGARPAAPADQCSVIGCCINASNWLR